MGLLNIKLSLSVIVALSLKFLNTSSRSLFWVNTINVTVTENLNYIGSNVCVHTTLTTQLFYHKKVGTLHCSGFSQKFPH